MLLHVGGTTTAGLGAVIAVIFLLFFSMSFAFGPIPEGEHKFSRAWVRAWFRASAPRLAIAGAFAGAILGAALLWGNSSSTSASGCDNPLPPFTGGNISDARIATAIASLNEMSEAATNGDRERVRTLFYTSDAHNLTHDIDRPFREKNDAAAKTLCAHVIALENQVAGPFELDAIAKQTQDIAADLAIARTVLPNNPTPAVSVLDPCAQPLPAITNDQLSPQRIQTAAGKLREAAAFAENGDAAGAQGAFAGDPHNITHDIDGPLRGVDAALATNLCRSILAIETHLGDKFDAQVMQEEAAKSADYLEQAGRALGIIR